MQYDSLCSSGLCSLVPPPPLINIILNFGNQVLYFLSVYSSSYTAMLVNTSGIKLLAIDRLKKTSSYNQLSINNSKLLLMELNFDRTNIVHVYHTNKQTHKQTNKKFE